MVTLNNIGCTECGTVSALTDEEVRKYSKSNRFICENCRNLKNTREKIKSSDIQYEGIRGNIYQRMTEQGVPIDREISTNEQQRQNNGKHKMAYRIIENEILLSCEDCGKSDALIDCIKIEKKDNVNEIKLTFADKLPIIIEPKNTTPHQLAMLLRKNGVYYNIVTDWFSVYSTGLTGYPSNSYFKYKFIMDNNKKEFTKIYEQHTIHDELLNYDEVKEEEIWNNKKQKGWLR